MSLSSYLTHLLLELLPKKAFSVKFTQTVFWTPSGKNERKLHNSVHGLLFLRLNISYPQGLGTCRKQNFEFGGLKVAQQFRLYI